MAEHDPPAALWGGEDGLVTVRAVERAAARLLKPGRPGRGRARRPAGRVGAGGVRARWADVRDHPRPGRPAPLHHRAPALSIAPPPAARARLSSAGTARASRRPARAAGGTARAAGGRRGEWAPRPRLRAATAGDPGAGPAQPRARRHPELGGQQRPGLLVPAAGGVRPARGGEQLDQPRLHHLLVRVARRVRLQRADAELRPPGRLGHVGQLQAAPQHQPLGPDHQRVGPAEPDHVRQHRPAVAGERRRQPQATAPPPAPRPRPARAAGPGRGRTRAPAGSRSPPGAPRRPARPRPASRAAGSPRRARTPAGCARPGRPTPAR